MSQEPMTDKILELFKTTQLTYQEIADTVGTSHKVVCNRVHRNFSKEEILKRKRINYSKSKMGVKNPMKGKTYDRHPNYKGEISNGRGYLIIRCPEWYKSNKQHVFVHHVVMAKALKLSCIPKGFVVHHIDGNKVNNELSNLALMTNSDHTRLHCWLRCRD